MFMRPFLHRLTPRNLKSFALPQLFSTCPQSWASEEFSSRGSKSGFFHG